MDAAICLGGLEKTEVGTVSAQKMKTDGDCLLIDIETRLICMGEKIPYEKSRLYLYGSVACIRAFSEAILAALPDEMPAIPFEVEHADAIPHLSEDTDVVSAEEVAF